ncbi:MAG: DNA polymerase III subunit delta [Bryobacterales bacterium]|nr:DNA polymerase III subunit delta [Bryobacterales bacterium]
MTPQQFLGQIKTKPGAVYLFLGPEMYRRRVCRRMLMERFLPAEMREEGVSRHDLEEATLRDVLDDASSFSLFASKRVIWVSGAEAAVPRGTAKDEDNPGHAALAAYVRNPAADTIVVFDSRRFTFDNEDKSKMDRLRKFYAVIPDVVEFAPYTPEEARKAAGEMAARSGLEIHPAALETLVESLGNDAARLASEIEKLALFTGGKRAVTEEDILRMAPDARSTTIFALVNALSQGNRAVSLDLLETLVREGEYLPLAITFLAAQFRFALAAKEEGLRSAQQVQGHFSKLGVAMWPSRAQQVMQTVNTFTRQKLEQAVVELYRADKALRDRSPDDRIVMERLVLALTK